MKLESLKKSLFGYKKTSVFAYISSVEEEFSTKLMEKDAQARKNEEQQLLRIRQLEDELRDVRQQLEKQKDEQLRIADTLLDAQRYADSLKKETEEKEESARQRLAESVEVKQRELDEYGEQIRQVRELVCALLNKTDGEARELESHIKTIRDNMTNMSLFSRNDESAAK